ncbi:protein YIF1B-B-like isoform X1 [Haliotis cracherodii]|uniref:protein YIF1B-B-like isoform X1 n=1 Tax=Haliotis rufescens TaxID=6454 RepID=UPI001EB054F5|nr:protein YIF1B-B-like isoform X1 [Haliotis rufescens]XP_046355886.1 protein YIF1B-B-like isoform X1 [Haliotis rufescens]
MDVPSGFRQRKSGQKRKAKGTKSQKPQLFQDTSSPPQPGHFPPPGNYGQPQGYDPSGVPPGGPNQFPGQQYIQDPMANMAMQYGSSWAGQSKDMLNKNIEQYVATSKIKYYFAVDTAYVGKKLGLLAFPFTHADWSIKYNQDEPVAPRYEVNAPDLYIPVMAFVTYILVAGLVLGTQDRFTPEQLGIQASSALVWFIIELLIVMFTLYVMNLKTDLKYLDIMSYLGYKFVGMIVCLLAGLVLQGMGYYGVLLWFSITLIFFLVRTLRVQIQPHSTGDDFSRGNKRSLYLILTIAICQPLLMWWLTYHIMFGRKQ